MPYLVRHQARADNVLRPTDTKNYRSAGVLPGANTSDDDFALALPGPAP
ncbi:hypothetical protein [Acetobacter peroxydans]|nr:hypothetical protein [Acetobacter peroxydans]MCH4142302.1 hypothetical protein [Acetobacter peroxydans]MCI1395419.1 hypothetical protein [Acetobacter peroxydans]MCI1411299.1 hypothetical protein [Acetobacter peroxydans]MCI1440075.1 hypothetical protein [Acetobacter peroxydans]MCI1566396.1 hypothetical protein [Acetobacter peroxydans]